MAMSWPGRSLAPGRANSRSAEEVAARVAAGARAAAELAATLREIEAAAAGAFPGNIFWDTELLAAELLRAGPGEIAAQGRRIAGLQALYGHTTAIRFRYVHDFLYGYDWAKWVQREPDERARVGPFAPAFIDHQERRARELEQLIAADDVVYPSLPEGQVRNPFPFSREPEAEALLLSDLAAARLLPVEAWDPAASPRWDRPYADLRTRRAAALGLLLPE
ncbi:ferrochelatase [Nannocystis punicea]|uniref:Ferrochelatase n=1 Tax=Nannocystis punicea TaxID=2995304 RepID=A0ABY7H4G6_9BACT|nr:ferrochelatase [Nannocystis poenicansa]WAS94152.1 ferrochelatase [Nannocystis poenicansa]